MGECKQNVSELTVIHANRRLVSQTCQARITHTFMSTSHYHKVSLHKYNAISDKTVLVAGCHASRVGSLAEWGSPLMSGM